MAVRDRRPDPRGRRLLDLPAPRQPDLPWNTIANAEPWAAELAGPAYAIDDETAIKVVDGAVEVVSEGHWKLLAPQHAEA